MGLFDLRLTNSTQNARHTHRLQKYSRQSEINVGRIRVLAVRSLLTAGENIKSECYLRFVVDHVCDLRLEPPILELQFVQRKKRSIYVVARKPGFIQIHGKQAVVGAAHSRLAAVESNCLKLMLIGAASRTVDLVDDVIVPILPAGEDRTFQLATANVLIDSQQKSPVVGIHRVSYDTLVVPVVHRDCCLAAYDGSFQWSRHTLKFVIE